MEAKKTERLESAGRSAAGLRVLYVGTILPGSTAVQRADALKDLGHQVTTLSTENSNEIVVKPSLPSRVRRRIVGPQDRVGANAGILRAMRSETFDVLWIDKGLTVHADTLRQVHELQPCCRIIGFSLDDMMNSANQSQHFLKGLPLYDHYITSKTYNVAELKELGCPHVLFVDNAYDPHTHLPVTVTAELREKIGGAVGFIGQWEPERAESLRKLALAGIPVRVWGYTWERMRDVPPGLVLENRPLWGDEYARALCAFDINLCFLRKCNRDLQTSRTMEIPACGGFMLAERTEEHLRLFKEGQEAEFFADDEEMIRKVRYYLDHPEERRRLAVCGRERCLRDGYSNAERLRGALDLIMASEPKANRNGATASVDIASSKSTGLNILYVGPMLFGSTTVQRAEALKDMGHQVTTLSTRNEKEIIVNPSLVFRVRKKIFGPQDRAGANAAILRAIRSETFDVMWIDKGLIVRADTLRQVHRLQPRCRIVGYSPDDMMNTANQTRHFVQGLPVYDHFITTKSYNVAELTGLGCPSVLFVDKSYDPHTHRPMTVSAEDRLRLGGAVGFIGQWETERAESLRKLALAGIPVRVWGFTWERMHDVPPGLVLENQPLWGEEYARALCAFDINLCFLRKCNRDLQTSRTMEIPACGGFLLAERTEEHLRLFKEGQEAEFFADDEEMIRKVRYYTDHPEERQRIAHAGYERCLRDGYSNAERLREALETIVTTKPHRAHAVWVLWPFITDLMRCFQIMD